TGRPRSGARTDSGKAARARAGPPPVFVEVHGGPTLQNPIVQFMFRYQILAAAGYTVILPNPRGSIGYGEKFTSKSNGDWGDGPFGDILACADDAIERGLADATRQFIGGYSYGGYMSSFAVGRTRRFKAAVIGAPVVNLTSEFGSSDAGRFLAEAVGDPWEARELVESQAPITYAPSVTTPVLLYVYEGDLRCPPSQCDEFFTALKWHGSEVEYVRYPGGSHLSALTMIGPPSQSEDRERRVLDWLARHGGVRAQAESTRQEKRPGRRPAPRRDT
ncbi:MAG: prolyl oligopeptidase family serine peptidase, partial [Acidimicrobiales bacterium]